MPRPWRVYSTIGVRLPKPFSVAVSTLCVSSSATSIAITLWPSLERHAAHAARRAAHRPHVLLVEAHRLAAVGEQHHVVHAVGERGADQVVARIEVDRDDAGLARVAELVEAVFLTMPCAVAMNT